MAKLVINVERLAALRAKIERIDAELRKVARVEIARAGRDIEQGEVVGVHEARLGHSYTRNSLHERSNYAIFGMWPRLGHQKLAYMHLTYQPLGESGKAAPLLNREHTTGCGRGKRPLNVS